MEPRHDAGSVRHGDADAASKRAGWKQRSRTTTLGAPLGDTPGGDLCTGGNDAAGVCNGGSTGVCDGSNAGGDDCGDAGADDGLETECTDRHWTDGTDEIALVRA